MKETDLSAAIDKQAAAKATQLLKDIRTAITNAVNPYWRPKVANESFVGDEIRRVLAEMAKSTEWQHMKLLPLNETVSNCRLKIVNDLLNGLPQIQALLEMASQAEEESE